jgi:hypothetical protein
MADRVPWAVVNQRLLLLLCVMNECVSGQLHFLTVYKTMSSVQQCRPLDKQRKKLSKPHSPIAVVVYYAGNEN